MNKKEMLNFIQTTNKEDLFWYSLIFLLIEHSKDKWFEIQKLASKEKNSSLIRKYFNSVFKTIPEVKIRKTKKLYRCRQIKIIDYHKTGIGKLISKNWRFF